MDKKKNYIQPIVERAEMHPMNIICTSTGYGGDTNSGDITDGD